MYKKLKIDFEVPEILTESFDDFVKNLNEQNGNLADCYEQDIRNTLNGCDECLTEDQINILRKYNVKGGIYKND